MVKFSTLGKRKSVLVYRVCGLRLGPNFGVRPTTGKNSYLSLTVKKMVALTIFTEKYLASKKVTVILRLRVTIQIQKLKYKLQKQSPRDVLSKRCSENI